MIYGSICSGIEAASVAWNPLGWRLAFLSEIEPFPRAVLQHRYPEVPLHGDFTTIEADRYEAIDLLVGGTPCQSFSVAGKRLGLDDPRGNLAIEYLGLARRLKPRWLVFENVPGLLSSDGGRDFGAFLGLLGQCGYGWAYRVLDAQFVRVDGFARAVPQRRRRVFVVGYLGDWRPPAAVLLEPESLRGDPAPRREAGQGIADPITSSFAKHGGASAGKDSQPRNLVAYGGNNTAGPIDVATCRTAHTGGHGRMDFESDTFVAHALRADGFDASEDGTGRGTPLVPEIFPAVTVKQQGANAQIEGSLIPVAFSSKDHGADAGGQVAVAFHENQRAELTLNDTAGSLKVSGGKPGQGYPAIHDGWAVRRLTPRECERLQGLPDDWTLVPYRGKPARDGPRYKAIGNSMAVNCMRWIGRRIEAMESNIRN